MFTALKRSLCPGGVSVQEGSLFRGSLCRGSMSRGLCPGLVYVQGMVSVQGGLCQGDPKYGYVRAVRILLQCIFVM